MRRRLDALSMKCLPFLETLANVRTAILSKVIDYCDYHKNNPAEEMQPLKSTNLIECGVSEWDAEDVNIEQEVLFELILAAYYLYIKSMSTLTKNMVDDSGADEETLSKTGLESAHMVGSSDKYAVQQYEQFGQCLNLGTHEDSINNTLQLPKEVDGEVLCFDPTGIG